MIEVGKKYYAMSVLCMPIEVLIMQVDYVKQKAEIKQGWISFSDLYENEADCPCR